MSVLPNLILGELHDGQWEIANSLLQGWKMKQMMTDEGNKKTR